MVERLVPPSPTATIIDVGCGTGANLAALAADYRCVGIDTSAEAIELAQQRFPCTKFLVGRAPEDLGQEMDHARLLLLTDVLEHVPDDFAMLSSLVAAMQPGSVLLLTVPADPKLWNRHDESFGHYRRYDRARLTAVWDGLPVESLLVSYFNRRLYPLVKAVRTVNRWRGHDRVAGAAGTDFKLPPRPLNRLLEEIFAGEAQVLGQTMRGERRAYSRGVSLMAVLRRTAGRSEIRSKPLGLAPDLFDPAAGRIAVET